MKVTMTYHCGSHRNVYGARATMKHSFDKDFRATENHISHELSDRNIVLRYENLEKAYEQEFGKAVEKYNKMQVEKGHPERQIESYLEKIGEDKPKRVLYENIIQFGARNDIGANNDSLEHIEAIKDYVKGWDERNPNMHLIGAVIHRDEPNGTDHLHLMYFPVARDMEKGIEVKNSYSQALNQMGFKTEKGKETAQIQWQAREKAELERLGREHGFEIEHKHGNREHYKKATYIAYCEKEEAEKEKEIAEKELKETKETLHDNRVALDNTQKDLNQVREELEQAKETAREMPQMPAPDGKGFKSGTYSPGLVKQICNNYRNDWLEERQEKDAEKARADKAEQTLKAFGDVKPHQLHDPDFLRDRAREIDRQYEQADKEVEEWEHEHSHQRNRDEIEIGSR